MPYVKWVTKRRQILPMFRGRGLPQAPANAQRPRLGQGTGTNMGMV